MENNKEEKKIEISKFFTSFKKNKKMNPNQSILINFILIILY